MELSRRERGGMDLLVAFVLVVLAVIFPVPSVGLVGIPFALIFAASGALRLAGFVD